MLDEGMESDNHADICIANTLQSPTPHLSAAHPNRTTSIPRMPPNSVEGGEVEASGSSSRSWSRTVAWTPRTRQGEKS